ncbi:MAG: PPC domain-containing protein [Deltaproteobacteria bacterium]|nr:PPC domain-containing protein [Deltaproteobacteria bacterium]
MRRFLFTCIAATAAACGGGGGSSTPDAAVPTPDAAPPADVCGTAAARISTYPGTFSGVTLGAGADLSVAMGACTDERDFFGNVGDDQVVQLDNLTPGKTYVLDLTTDDDLSFYVTTACDAAGPTAGSCLLYVDQKFTNETGDFVAPASGSVAVVIDASNDPEAPTTGAYTLAARLAECAAPTDCTDASKPMCSNFSCVQCVSSFDCTDAAAPVCDATGTCVAGSAMCTGTDTGEQDDGPAAATTLAVPTAGNPTVVSDHAVCSSPAIEDDWYKITLTAATSLRIQLAWTDAAADLDVILKDATGADIDGGVDTGAGPETIVDALDPGTYYLEVYRYSPTDDAALTPYTLSVGLPECSTNFDCNAAKPVCDVGACVAGPATCVGDDVGDLGTGDDGPAAARVLATAVVGTPVTLTGSLCSDPATEADWYKVINVGAGEGLVLSISGFTDPQDLDIAVFDSTGKLVGVSFWLNPDVVTLTYLPAGTYYARVLRVDAPTTPTEVAPYTISAKRTAAQTCTSSTDCAATYDTQLYRGACTAGACHFIPAGTAAAGAACDSADDCQSAHCSYLPFESDAQKSVCTTTCTAPTDCTTGYTCTTGLSTNVCVPMCSDDFQCGADAQSSTIDTGHPWDYFTCTSGVCGA